MLNIFDTHTHLDSSEFDQDREAVIARALELGVTRILCVGASQGLDSAKRAITLAENYDFIYASAGLHPHDANLEINYSELAELALHPRVVAIGETGLDFFRDWGVPPEKQYSAFRKQIEIAKNVQKPLIIHSRAAGEECFKVLQEESAHEVGGVFHCYAEDENFAKRLVDLNFLVSFPGTITFKKADALRAIVKAIPIERILLETDAPYMSPEPMRGKRCETGFTLYTAEKLAEIKGLTIAEVASITTANALKLFKVKS
jgi:TatD DNase family protein